MKVISLPYIFQVLYFLCFTRPRYQVSVYRTIGPLFFLFAFLSVTMCVGHQPVHALHYHAHEYNKLQFQQTSILTIFQMK